MTPALAELLSAGACPEPARRLHAGRAVWVFGTGRFGRDVAQALRAAGLPLAGFIESKPQQSSVKGLPVVALAQAAKAAGDSQVVLGVFNRGMPFDELQSLLQQAGLTDVFMPWDVYAQLADALGWRYWLSDPETILADRADIEQASAALADEESRRCFAGICGFRLGRNPGYASYRSTEAQYFNDLTLAPLAGRPVTYVDGGAYNGDTLAELQGCAQVRKAYLFEPDPDNFRSLVQAAQAAAWPAVCLPLGLADTYRFLAFTSGAGESGALSENGGIRVALTSLDASLPAEAIDFIKLDVEGGELAALNGARSTIARCRPVLAISLYHKPQDLWQLPLWVDGLGLGYRLYIRQHWYNTFDAVLYAIPSSA